VNGDAVSVGFLCGLICGAGLHEKYYKWKCMNEIKEEAPQYYDTVHVNVLITSETDFYYPKTSVTLNIEAFRGR